MPTGMLLAPVGKPELRGFSPSDTPESKVDTGILLKYAFDSMHRLILYGILNPA